MRYQGSKLKLIKILKPIIESNISNDEWYVEPFAGGFNCIAKINAKHKIANDINKYTVALWRDIQSDTFLRKYGDFIKNLTKEQYKDVYEDYKKNGTKYPDSVKGYVGFACSNSSGWWKGYANYNEKRQENHILEAYSNLKRQVEGFIHLENCVLQNASYDEIEIPDNSFIYCDPPYSCTEGYKVDFDNDKFWDWCRGKVKQGNKVLISEFSAPKDFVAIWEKPMQNGYGTKSQTKIEKLYIHKTQINIFRNGTKEESTEWYRYAV